MNECEIKLGNCKTIGYKKVMGKWYCKNCLDEIWAMLQVLDELRKEQKSNTIKVNMEDLEKRFNKNLIPLRDN
jgi:hypothetical protein